MSGKPTVSIALATYNGARFLQAQLDSLAAQSLMPAELVVGDDVSSDETMAILEAFAARAPFPVRLHRNETRLDYGDNFMRTALRCTGDYVAFCDQDDVWAPEKLERCATAMTEHGAAICAHRATFVDAELNPKGLVSANAAPGVHEPLTLDPADVFQGFTLMVRRDLLDLAAIDDRPDDLFRPGKKLSHDRWAYFLGSTFGRSVYIDAPLALYRQHGQNTFGAGGAMTWAALRERVQIAAAEQAKQQEISQQKARLLRALADRTQGETQRAARAGAAYWTRLAGIYGERRRIATAPSLVGRLGAFWGLMLSGGYGRFDRGGLTVRALGKDLAVALMGARTTKPPPRGPGT